LMSSAAVLGFVLTILLPPEQFDRPYQGELFIVERQIADVHGACGGVGPRMFACSMPIKGGCLIVLPKVEDGWITKEQQERLLRHETGHCNGWGADHAGGRLDDAAW
jgi:hypothetical protein